jgi:multimeric flavodoxin WrbA
MASALPPFIHHGMIYVPPGYSFGAPMFDIETVRGGSAWGAGTFAGADGSRKVTDVELEQAKHQVRQNDRVRTCKVPHGCVLMGFITLFLFLAKS